MTGLALLLIVAAAGFGLAKWLRFPVIPLLLAAGVLLSTFEIEIEHDFVQNALELGLTFLLFVAGIELNPARFGRQRKAALWVGIAQFSAMAISGWLVATLLGFEAVAAAYVASALAASSTLVVLRHLRLHQQMFEPFGRLVTGVLLFQDLIIIVALIVLMRLPKGAGSVALGLAYTAGLFGFAMVCQRWLMPLIVMRLKVDDETLLLAILAVLFGYVGLSVQLGLPTIAGAFLAGFSLSAFPVNGLVRGLIASLADFFMAIFFTALGAIIILPTGEALFQAAVFTLLVVLLTPPLVTLVAEWTGLSSRASIECGLLLAQTSEFSLVLGLSGLVLGHISQELFSVFALVTVTTMTLTPFVATDAVTRFLLRFHPLRRRLSAAGATEGHVLMLGFGASGMWVLKPLQAEGHNVLVVDDDPAVIEQLRKSGIPCIRGDGSDEKVLEKAGARRAKLIIVGMRRVSEAEKVLQHVRNVPVVVRVFEAHDAEHIRRLGGKPILNSTAAADTFMDWFEKTGGGAARASAQK